MHDMEWQNNQKLLDSMALSQKSIKIDNDIGKCLSDFEILQVLGEGAFGFVAKVKSKKNLKIYAMKKYDLSLIDNPEQIKYYKNEAIFMRNLEHPNIIKLYTNFIEDDIIYMIMEFMDNGDLFNFLSANVKLENNIKEEKLWNIFEQCLKGLLYIHSKGLIHRDIKPANILMNTEGQVKLGDFNVSALINIEKAKNFTNDSIKEQQLLNIGTQVGSGIFQAPEVKDIENEDSLYDDKVDIYSMGITFCSLAFYRTEIPSNAYKLYSRELVDIIKRMIDTNKYKRPNSATIYNDFIKSYVEKYIHSTGIISCINCLSLYPSFINFFLEKGDDIGQSNEISYQFNKIIRALNIKNMKKGLYNSVKNNPEKKSFNYLVFEFRELLYKYGIKKFGNGSYEIEPISIISLLLKKLHEELNIKKNVFGRGINFFRKVVQRSNRKQEAFENFMIFYNNNFESIISNNFFCLIKTKRRCKNCNVDDYLFDMINFIPFNIQILKSKYHDKKVFNITDAFDCLNKNYIELDENQCVKCENCNNKKQVEFKQFYDLPKNLLIFFDRGENYKYQDFIDFEQKLVLTNYVECFTHYNQEVIYDLLGIICKVEIKKEENEDFQRMISRGKYISFVYSKNHDGYINTENNKKYDLKTIKSLGIVVGLFYYCDYISSNIIDNSNIGINNINNSNSNINNGFGMDSINNSMGMNNIYNINNYINNINMRMNNMNHTKIGMNIINNKKINDNNENINMNYFQFNQNINIQKLNPMDFSGNIVMNNNKNQGNILSKNNIKEQNYENNSNNLINNNIPNNNNSLNISLNQNNNINFNNNNALNHNFNQNNILKNIYLYNNNEFSNFHNNNQNRINNYNYNNNGFNEMDQKNIVNNINNNFNIKSQRMNNLNFNNSEYIGNDITNIFTNNDNIFNQDNNNNFDNNNGFNQNIINKINSNSINEFYQNNNSFPQNNSNKNNINFNQNNNSNNSISNNCYNQIYMNNNFQLSQINQNFNNMNLNNNS